MSDEPLDSEQERRGLGVEQERVRLRIEALNARTRFTAHPSEETERLWKEAEARCEAHDRLHPPSA